jgi:hypothetical protein
MSSPPRGPKTPHEELERVVANYYLTFATDQRQEEAEWSSLPPAVDLYWRMVVGLRPPKQYDFVNEYLVYAGVDSPLNPIHGGVKYRVQRSYCSYVRQHHAELVLQQAYPWTFRSRIADLQGVDLLVIAKGKPYGLAFSQNTDASRQWAARKEKRRSFDPPPFPVLPVWADQGEHVVGHFFLHHPKKLTEQVRAWIDSGAKA